MRDQTQSNLGRPTVVKEGKPWAAISTSTSIRTDSKPTVAPLNTRASIKQLWHISEENCKIRSCYSNSKISSFSLKVTRLK